MGQPGLERALPPALFDDLNYAVYGLGSEMIGRVTAEGDLNVRKRYAVAADDIYLQGRASAEGRREFSVGGNRGGAGRPEATCYRCHRAIDQREVVGMSVARRGAVQVTAAAEEHALVGVLHG